MRLFLLPLFISIPLVAASPSLLDILSDELERNFTVLKQKGDPPPYYMSYSVTEAESQVITASIGTLTSRNTGHARYLDITIRVGSPALDNYHLIKGERARFTPGSVFPLDDVADAIRRKLWLDTDRTYRAASRRLIEIKSNQQVKLQQADDSADFSSESPAVHGEPPPRLRPLDSEWPARCHG